MCYGETWQEAKINMENMLNEIYCWTFQNKLLINIAKTKFMTFGNKIDSIPIHISITVSMDSPLRG